MADDGGVLGNLPRSRPGQRSEKRGQGAKAGKRAAGRSADSAAAAAEGAERTEAPAAEPAREARQAGRARATPAAGPRQVAGAAVGEDQRTPPETDSDALGQAVRAATGVAGAGVRVAGAGVRVGGAVARELLRRLPRP